MHCQFCGAALEKVSEACPFCGSQVVLGERYEIRAVLGRGAMGEVFYAYDRRLANEVALKRLNPQLTGSQELRESLTREARIMAKLSDAGIVRLFDLAEYESGLYLVLEYVCGPNLREMLRAGYRASAAELAGVMSQICQALTAAHQQGVIHRDLKPSNVLVALRSPERDAFQQSRQIPKSLHNAQVKIADFGIAKAIAESKSTLTNAFSGTPGYMAPEQFRGETPSPATDVYALGAMSYELLTGKLPTQPMPPVPSVPPLVFTVLKTATHANRASRFQSASEFYAALFNAVEGRPFQRAVARPAAPPPVGKILAVALAAVGAIFAVAFFLAFQDKPPVIRQKTTLMPVLRQIPEEKPLDIVAHSAPRTEAEPPPVPEAEGVLAESGLIGPKRPKIQWSITLAAISVTHTLIGSDGTLYTVTIRGEVCAIRDGKIAWAYKTSFGAIAELSFDKQGRLWVHDFNDNYCFNRDGVGGRMPPKFQPPPQPDKPLYHCIQNHQLWGPGIQLDLDADCSTSSVATRPGGPIYVGTDQPQIMALNRRAETLWKIKPECEPNQLLTLGSTRLIYICKEGGIHNLEGQQETWSHPTAGTLSNHMIADAEGVLYYSDSAHAAGGYELHAIDSAGNVLSSLDLQGTSLNDLLLGGQKQLYAVGSGLDVRILRLAD